MRRIHAGHWLGLAVFFAAPLAVVAPKGEVALLALVALPLLARTLSRGSLREIYRTPFAVVALALLLWGALSALWALDLAAALHRAGTLALLTVASLVLFSAADYLFAEERGIVRKAAVAGLVLAGALLFFELVAGLPVNAALRAEGGVLKPTVLNGALSIVVILVWPVALILRQAGAIRLALGVLLLFIVVLVLGEGNSARVAFGIAALAAVTTLHWPAFALRAAAIVVTIGILAAPLLPETLLTPARWSAMLATTTDSAMHRLHIWQFSAERIAEKPIMGWGLDASRIIPGGDVEVIEDGASMQLHPHNAPLQLWLELGLPGALGLVAITLIALSSARYLPREARAASIAATIAALTIASLSFGIWQHWWLATLALSAVTVKVAVDEAEPLPP